MSLRIGRETRYFHYTLFTSHTISSPREEHQLGGGSSHHPVKLLRPIRHSMITVENTLNGVLCQWGRPPGLYGLHDQKGSDCFWSRSAASWFTSPWRVLTFPWGLASCKEGISEPGPQASSSCGSTALTGDLTHANPGAHVDPLDWQLCVLTDRPSGAFSSLRATAP